MNKYKKQQRRIILIEFHGARSSFELLFEFPLVKVRVILVTPKTCNQFQKFKSDEIPCFNLNVKVVDLNVKVVEIT